ncbi:mechanosensitive ion channel family protein [Deefgea piscis]|uniref:Small-conductance mechanosensitive channel n=1 Tax=Deefgea piscis TaxID=2739061 RepID=A0A6M8SSM6_9NEIS|nr:mechanosensitive ion channel family protein [Deefgea piscis]QKJ66430.1 mechanosensitive ion channel family protein [Deefgea piscis]
MMRKIVGLICILLLAWTSLAYAAEENSFLANTEASQNEDNEALPLTVDNRTLAVFRVGISSYTQRDRVEAAKLRLARIIKTKGLGKVSSMPVIPPGVGVAILLDGQMVFTIQPGDVNELAGETMVSVVEKATEQLSMLINDRRELNNPKQLLFAGLHTLVASVVLFLGLWILSRARPRMLKLGHSYLAQPIARVAKNTVGVTIASLNQSLQWVVRIFLGLLILSLLYSWASYVFLQFPLTRAWSENLNVTIFGFLGKAGLAVLDAVPGLLVVAFIVVCTRYLSMLMAFFFNRIERGELSFAWFDRDTAGTTRRILSVLIWLLALAMIYPYLPGANTEAFKGLSVILGLMVSLGASSVVGQFASGFILVYSKSLKQGEFVQIGNTEGTVAHIGLFATKIHTNLREEISIPNSVLFGQNVVNYSRLATNGGVISQIVVTIGYDVAWRQVEAMLLMAAQQTAGVRADPPPRVFQTGLLDFYVEYHLRVALDEPQRRMEILHDLNGKVQDVFNTYGIQIMSPNYRADPEQEKLVPVEQWYRAPAKKE